MVLGQEFPWIYIRVSTNFSMADLNALISYSEATTLDIKFNLTQEQISFFDSFGYLRFNGMLADCIEEIAEEFEMVWRERGGGHDGKPHNGKSRSCIVPFIDQRDRLSALIDDPRILGIATGLLGENFNYMGSDGNYYVGDTGWHSDGWHPTIRHIKIAIYLDPLSKETGCLRVIPGSQIQRQDVCQIRDNYGWDHPSAIDVEMEPGDILLHDVMVVHGSARTAGNALRRTIYYEFRAAEEIVEDGPWDREWIDRRMRLIPLGLRACEKQFPTADQFAWHVSDEFRPAVSPDVEAELKIVHQVHMNGAWCSAGDAG